MRQFRSPKHERQFLILLDKTRRFKKNMEDNDTENDDDSDANGIEAAENIRPFNPLIPPPIKINPLLIDDRPPSKHRTHNPSDSLSKIMRLTLSNPLALELRQQTTSSLHSPNYHWLHLQILLMLRIVQVRGSDREE
jgi:hypothetical protein